MKPLKFPKNNFKLSIQVDYNSLCGKIATTSRPSSFDSQFNKECCKLFRSFGENFWKWETVFTCVTSMKIRSSKAVTNTFERFFVEFVFHTFSKPYMKDKKKIVQRHSRVWWSQQKYLRQYMCGNDMLMPSHSFLIFTIQSLDRDFTMFCATSASEREN